jgi:hypothetical protein
MSAVLVGSLEVYPPAEPPRYPFAEQQDDFFRETYDIVVACVTGASNEDSSENAKNITDVVTARLEEMPEFFESTCQQLGLNTTNFNIRLIEVWEGIFSDNKYNWGRVISLLAFCHYVCTYSQSYGLPPTVMDSIPSWLTIFIATRLKQWITAQGGWVMIYQCHVL